MKSLYDLVRGVLLDFTSSLPVSTKAIEKDLTVIRNRVENEGVSFLTLTLPEFGKAFLRCIELGEIEPNLFPSFGCRHGIPDLFRGITALVFDLDTRKLKLEPNVNAIALIRQVCCLCSKVKCEFSPRQKYCAERKFIECDDSICDIRADQDLRLFARILWSGVLKDYNSEREDLRFKHGPGAVCNPHIRGFQKYCVKDYTQSLDDRFPFADSLFCNYNQWVAYIRSQSGHLLPNGGYGVLTTLHGVPCETPVFPDRASSLFSVESSSPSRWGISLVDDVPVRVVFVPKTVKGPRTIAIEPAYMQFIQQGIKNYLYALLESNPLTAGSVNFTDQTISQEFARKSSIDRKFATVDLSDASDSVAWSLVQDLFHVCPDFVEDLSATRTKFAMLPSGKVKPLFKFASMGSALCFPIEAMVFYTLAQLAYHKVRGIAPSQGSIRRAAGEICIYGDDIVVPTDVVETLYQLLKRYGLKVNQNKSFYKSHFREACGKEYYNGYDITPVYLRVDIFRQVTENTEVAELLPSYFAFRNAMYDNGAWSTVRDLDTAYLAREILPGARILRTNTVYSSTCGCIGRRSYLGYEAHKWDAQLQTWRTRGYCIKAIKKKLPETIERLERYLSLSALNEDQIRELFPKSDTDWSREVEHSRLSRKLMLSQ